MRLASKLDRYPAKMVTRLADELIVRYASDATRLLDPFCGSAAILQAAQRRGIPVTGIDINPLAALFASVKLQSFDFDAAHQLGRRWIEQAVTADPSNVAEWPGQNYWFSPVTLKKYQQLRAAGPALRLSRSREGRALLMAYGLSVRLCSRADQRSPKPFISKRARSTRGRRHFDPFVVIGQLLCELGKLYAGKAPLAAASFVRADLTRFRPEPGNIGRYSHIITSPPYINAQDYFRNFKLELHLMEKLLPFSVSHLKERFIGTERGDLLAGVPASSLALARELVPDLAGLGQRDVRLAAVVSRYVHDMERALRSATSLLDSKGRLVLICGDNLVGGVHIPTWQVLQRVIERQGFQLFDSFTDRIHDRQLAPKRSGHKGLIKEEVVLAFRRK